MTSDLPGNADRFSGFADHYDVHRPQPPAEVMDILTQFAQIGRPRLVVDLRCGTGLSTRLWAGRVEQVLGIEPNADMRRKAEERTAALPNAGNVRYQEGYSVQTGLPDECADIVTCSQCLHWMKPKPTFAEVARILRPGGVFAAYDHDLPPTVNWQAEVACKAFMEQSMATLKSLGLLNVGKRWPKDEHLKRMQKGRRFRFV